jgi:hypothetical protein
MRAYNEIAEANEPQDEVFSEDPVNKAPQIEEILSRAYEIHRVRGGLFGYDLEDWLQAEREFVEGTHADHFEVQETARAESLPENQEKGR